jgi:hypothetical protein
MAQPRIVPINVSSRVLRHISRGIYRTPAGALKELVSNSYDAGARQVTVTTGWPTLREIVITDNGRGMTTPEFEDIVQHIGFSNKNLGDEILVPRSPVKRRTIGHYGIGLLAVGQLANAMRVTSKTAGTVEGFTAEIDFDQFEQVREDGVDRAEVRDEATLERSEHRARHMAGPVLRIGQCRITSNRYDKDKRGSGFTRVILTGIRKFVHQHLAGDLAELNPQWRRSKAYSANFQELLRLLRENEGNARQGWYPYERLIWEMGVYCPIPYPDVGQFKAGGKLHRIARLATAPDFELRIDGILVRKPFEDSFFDDPEYPVEEIFCWHDKPFVEGHQHPRTSGYLIYKRRIRPRALQGILVRENGVAVGAYDPTYLHYPFNEGQKFNQLTGEVYAQGLSGAMNIDRNSFNETDDLYISLSKWVHRKLQTDVFSRIKELQSSPEASRRAQNRTAIADTLSVVVGDIQGRIRNIRFTKHGRSSPLLSIRGHTLFINQDHRDGSGSSAKREKALLAAALVLKGIATPADIAEVDDIVQKAKKALKARG